MLKSAPLPSFAVSGTAGSISTGMPYGSRGAPRLLPELLNPLDNSTGVAAQDALVTLHFNEAVTRGAGVIYVTDGVAQTVIDRTTGQPTMRIVGASDTRAIPIGDASRVEIVDGRVTLHLGELRSGVSYNVLMGRGVITDLTGTAFAGIADSTVLNFVTSPAATGPSTSRVYVTSADGAYKVGSSIKINVEFSEAVTHKNGAGLVLETGAIDRIALYDSGDGTNTLTFNYTVQEGDQAFALALKDGAALIGSVADLSGNLLANAGLKLVPGVLLNAAAGLSHIVIDGTHATDSPLAPLPPNAPALTSASDTGHAGDGLTTDHTPSFWISGTPMTGTIKLYDNGIHLGDYPIASVGYTQITAPALALGTHVFTVVTTNGSGTSATSASTTMTLTDAIVSIDTADLRSGDTATVTMQFVKPVSALDASHFHAATGVLSGFAASNGGHTWTATFTPNTALDDASNVIELIGSALTFADGSHGVSATYTSENFGVHTSHQVQSFSFASMVAHAGSEVEVTLDFFKPVNAIDPTAFAVAGGTLSGFEAHNGLWRAMFKPDVTGTRDESNAIVIDMSKIVFSDGTHGTGVYTSPNYIVDTRVTTHVNDDIRISNDNGRFGDDLVTGAAVLTVSGTYSGTLKSGETLHVERNGVPVDPAMVIVDPDMLTWSYTFTQIEGLTEVTAAIGNAGLFSAAAALQYEVDQTGPVPLAGSMLAGIDPTTDLVIQFDDLLYWGDISAMVLTGNGRTINIYQSEMAVVGDTIIIPAAKHGMVVNQEYTLSLPGGFTDHAHFLAAPITLRTHLDDAAPVATGLVTTSANGTYKVGDTIRFEMTFNEAVKVDGAPVFYLATGEHKGMAHYESGAGTSKLTFAYEVSNEEMAAHLSVDSLTGIDHQVVDLAGNAVTGSVNPASAGLLRADGTASAIVVDGVRPEVIGRQVAGDGTILLSFSEEIKFDSGAVQVYNDLLDLVYTYLPGSGRAVVTLDAHGKHTVLALDPVLGGGDYIIEWSDDAVQDLAGNLAVDLVGISVPATAF